MESTKHIQIIYDRLSEMEENGKTFGLQVLALFPNRELQITGKFSGLDALKNAINKAKEIEASAVKILEFNTPGDRSKLVNEEIVVFSRDFLLPEKKEIDENPIQHKTLIDSPDKIQALSTLGGIEGVISITSQLSQKDNQIALLKSEHRYELDKARSEADNLRNRLFDKIEEIDKLKKELDLAQNHKIELDKKSEELSGLEKKLAPRELMNSLGAQVLTNIAEKMIQKNPSLAGLMGFLEDEPAENTAEQSLQDKQSADVTYEEQSQNNIQLAVQELAKFLNQFQNEQSIRNIIQIIQFVQEIPERHTVILNTITQYVNQLNNTQDAESDDENQD